MSTNPVEQYQRDVGQGRLARRRSSTNWSPRSRRRSRSSPDRSTRSSTRPRRSRSASPAATRASSTVRSCRRCSPPAPGATCSATERSRCSPTSIPRCRGHRVHPVRHRRRRDHVVDRGGISRELRSRVDGDAGARRARSAASPAEREVLVARGRQRRPHGDLRARGEGGHVHRHHAVARALPRPPRRRRRCAACCRATTAATTASSTG